ncbi:MAG: hypothetical protein COW24_00335 [Candidatus Kerfeldbacteria bacterium CG15_BIG_FIL_POST_REV_8_21_14_020_45_12]|uniref:Response regulatory domain-containing protein n=1 Tax=Candidatus Kerfeldbacteria bacterium CG15_BIG_FIL_POST_REV_8_21_14_020_45_12 TaxID=2014247 RepID=A0A2M7H565_9BACT|nr:MAG: hypothetical protein COW24_00335 [Candidatus Kerfeldbacteria bacterium CG15_BIG_FIL_POST_REV_8_21_14_020_45_12]PJA92808.1 MAG: hypothetical protein CO132_06065 [Candidatus Kerfeldbacteria bacterium CG_4_9_14_3_um_filter_45_8]
MDSAKKKILIVEDEAPIARALSDKLGSSGFDCLHMSNGREALDAMKTETFDLILLDLLMPRMDGYEFLKALQDNKVNTPVIVASNLGGKDDIESANELGVKDFIIKANSSLGEIVERVTRFLSDN